MDFWKDPTGLEYALALMSHSFNHMQEKTQHLEAVATSSGLRINKSMKVKANNSQTVTLANGSIDEVEEFTFLGSVVSTTEGTDKNAVARL